MCRAAATEAVSPPSTTAWAESEKVVAAITKMIAKRPPRSWIARESPVRRSACSGSEEPAMKPATQAIACSASTSRFAIRICSTWPQLPTLNGGSIVWTRKPPAPEMPAIAQVAASSVVAASRLPANQRRTAGHGSACQPPRVSRVRRTP